MSNSEAYNKKKQQLASILTIYGRKPALEALENPQLHISRLHLADSNKTGGTLARILQCAEARNIETLYHSRQALARISKNGKQDQGVALDIELEGFADYRDFLADTPHIDGTFIALDNITNPQNLGMIIRTVCASPARALLMPRKGCARMDALVIKASAGTLFKARILWCDSLAEALADFRAAGAEILGLSSESPHSLYELSAEGRSRCQVFALGNETCGLSEQVEAVCDRQIRIPMQNSVESLNVAVTAGIITFHFQH